MGVAQGAHLPTLLRLVHIAEDGRPEGPHSVDVEGVDGHLQAGGAAGHGDQPTRCRQLGDPAGQAGISVGEPVGVMAGQQDVHPPVAEVDVGVVVDVVGRRRHRSHERRPGGVVRSVEPRLDGLEEHPPVPQVVACHERCGTDGGCH